MNAPEWVKSAICGTGPYTVEEMPGLKGAFYVADSKGFNCWTNTNGLGAVATSCKSQAEQVADKWNG